MAHPNPGRTHLNFWLSAKTLFPKWGHTWRFWVDMNFEVHYSTHHSVKKVFGKKGVVGKTNMALTEGILVLIISLLYCMCTTVIETTCGRKEGVFLNYWCKIIKPLTNSNVCMRLCYSLTNSMFSNFCFWQFWRETLSPHGLNFMFFMFEVY